MFLVRARLAIPRHVRPAPWTHATDRARAGCTRASCRCVCAGRGGRIPQDILPVGIPNRYKGLRCSFESSESIKLQVGRNGCGGGGFLSAACGGGTLWVLRGSSGRERRLVGGRKELSQQIARVPYDSQRARCFSRSSVACVSVFFTHNQKF